MRAKWLFLAAVGLGFSVACHTRPPNVAPSRSTPAPAAPARAVPAPPPPAPRPVTPRTLSEKERFEQESLNDLNARHPLGDAFFDYDMVALRDDARQALQQDATWLSKWPTTRITIQGHCDERGTPEYNLALGDRRAEAVATYLTSLGVDRGRIVTRSLGKEAPFCRDGGESCWAQNRRGHFVITAK